MPHPRPRPQVGPDPLLNVPLQNAKILEREELATFTLSFDVNTGQSRMEISGNFPTHTLLALLSLTHLKLLQNLGWKFEQVKGELKHQIKEKRKPPWKKAKKKG